MRSAYFLLLLWLPALTPLQAHAGPLKIYGMENRPTSFMDGERPAGMAVDLVAEIQHRLGQAQPFEIIPWTRANTLARGPDVMLAAVVRTPERAHLRKRDPDFTRLRAGGQRSTVFSSLPRRLGYNLTDEPNSAEAAAKMLMSGRFDLWFIADELVPDTLRKAGFAPDAVTPAFHLSVEGVYFAFSPGTDERVVEAWTVTLRQMKRDGSFLRIHRKWLKEHQLPPDVIP